MSSFPLAVGCHALHHVVEGLGVHHVVVVVHHLDGSVLVQVAICLCVGHGIMAGEGGDECHDVFGYVSDAKHGFVCILVQSYKFSLCLQTFPGFLFVGGGWRRPEGEWMDG